QHRHGDGLRLRHAPRRAHRHRGGAVRVHPHHQLLVLDDEEEVGKMSEKTLRARKRRDPLSVFLRVIVWLAALITVGVFVALVGYILIKGVPNLSLDLFQLKYTSDNCSMLPAIFNTIFMTLLSLVVAVPLGIF